MEELPDLLCPIQLHKLDKGMLRRMTSIAERVAAAAALQNIGKDLLLRVYLAGLYHGVKLSENQGESPMSYSFTVRAADGWRYEAPLLGMSELNPSYLMKREGLEPPRLYAMGYLHNNCGGFCCKAGQAHWQNRFRVQPERFAYDAMMERRMAEYIGEGAWSMLTDRRGDGKKKPLTLDAFAARLAANPQIQIDYAPGESGCGCMLDDGEISHAA